MATKFSVEAIFKAVDQMSAPIRKMQSRTEKLTRGIDRGLRTAQRASDKLAGSMKKAAAVTAIGLAAMTAAIADVSQVGGEFETSMVSATTKMGILDRKAGEGARTFKLLEDTARKAGTTTEFTAKQSAEAFNFLAMAGFNAEQSISALPAVLDLATSSGVELAEASDIATDALGSFNLMTKDAGQLQKNLTRITDVMAATTTSANTSMTDMYEAMKDGGPVATAAGASIETFAALTGKLADAGIKGSKAGTTLKNMFLKLSAATPAAQKTLKRLGVQTQDASGNMLDIIDILDQLGTGLDGLGTAQRAAILDQVFGKRAIAGVNVLLGAGTENLKEYRTALENAQGSSAKMAASMRDTFGVEWLNLNAVIDDTKISIFELIKGPLKQLFSSLKQWIIENKGVFESVGKAFKWLIEHPKLIMFVVGIIGTLTTALSILSGVIGIASTAMFIFNLALAMNPIVLTIGLIIAGLVLLGAAVAAVIIYWDEWTSWLRESSTAFKVIVGVLAFMSGPIGIVIYALAMLAAHWDTVKEEAGIAIDFIFDQWKKLTDMIDKFNPSKMFEGVDMGIIKDASIILKNDLMDTLPEWMGGNSDEEIADRERSQVEAPVMSSQAVLSREIRESKNSSELTIRDESGRAEMTGSTGGGIPGLKFASSGAL